MRLQAVCQLFLFLLVTEWSISCLELCYSPTRHLQIKVGSLQIQHRISSSNAACWTH